MSARTSPRRTNRRPPSLMLWSRPTRAQPPMVDVVKWTLAAARISAASPSVIQSVGAAISSQSVFDAAPVSTGFFGPDVGFSAVARSDVEDFSDPEDLSALEDPSLPEDLSRPADPSPPEDPSLPEDPSVAALADEPAPVRAAWRSFFAQPEPL